MGIFKKKKQDTGIVQDHIGNVWKIHDQPISVNYENVMDWLVGLSKEDYTKVFKVADIYRQADYDANTTLGRETSPVTRIELPDEDEISLDGIEFDDELASGFIPTDTKDFKKPAKKIQVEETS